MIHTKFIRGALITSLIAIFCIGCRKTSSEPQPIPGGTDSIRLLFHKYTKINGTMPVGPLGNNKLKISIRDTFSLIDQVLRPIKFLHKDVNNNVAGVYVRVALNGSASASYYDVPEIEPLKESDTVSVITIGIDPLDIPKPQSGKIIIVPYDKNKQPITQIEKAVKIIDNKVDPPAGGNGSCGLGTSNQKWVWDVSHISDNGDFIFYNEPNKVHSAGGQDIEGSCCNGHTRWPLFCVGETSHNKRLHFATYYRINFETFVFFSNGSFARQTMEDAPVPIPAESDFCSGGTGKIRESIKHTAYSGTWAVSPANIPANSPSWLKKDSLQLDLTTLNSSGVGYGNRGGIIHHLDCKEKILILIEPDREGRGRHLTKLYYLKESVDDLWFY